MIPTELDGSGDDAPDLQPGNAFDRLQAGARKDAGFVEPRRDSEGNLCLFAPACTVTNARNNKESLHLALWHMCGHNLGIGWLCPDHADKFGQPFLKALSDLLWEITDQHGTLLTKVSAVQLAVLFCVAARWALLLLISLCAAHFTLRCSSHFAMLISLCDAYLMQLAFASACCLRFPFACCLLLAFAVA